MNLLHLNGVVENIMHIFHKTNVHSVLNTIMIVAILSYGIFTYYFKKVKSKSNKINGKIIQNLNPELSQSIQSSKKVNSIGISDFKEQDLIKKLIEIESSEIFLEKNISLTKLASYLNTNTKYLSHVIKKHSDRDFNNYINLLRIQYVVNKLNEDSKFRNYKISAIADEAGFSSHSKFTHFFKLNLGESPSSYILKIKQSKSQQISNL